MTSIYRNGTVENGGSGESAIYEGSYMYQWLNEDFYDTLRYSTNYLTLDYLWNATVSWHSSIPQKTTMVNGAVGALNRYEYIKSYTNTTDANGYLNVSYEWWLMNPYDGTSTANIVRNSGSVFNPSYSSSRAIRPVINLKANLLIASGNGTASNPYRLLGDNDQEVNLINKNINTRYSGEYVRFNSEDYRIMKIEGNLTKIVKVDYFKSGGTNLSKAFAPSGNTLYSASISEGTSYWGGYLNDASTGWYSTLDASNQNMIETGTWYSGTIVAITSYKLSICATVTAGTLTSTCIKTTESTTAKVGLIRIGEMFSTQLDPGGYTTAVNLRLLTPFNTTNVFYISTSSTLLSNVPTNSYATRPVLYLKSNVKIASGDGTPSNPFTLTIT